MTESEIFFDMPCEPHVHTPKASFISKVNNPTKTDAPSSEGISIIHKLSKAKFPVYLAKYNNKNYAIKVFPMSEEDNKPDMRFKNETRFASLNHPHIIKTFHFKDSKAFSFKNSIKTVSYTLMEYAAHGDSFDFLLKNKPLFRDDKLIRTYFRQLIEGLEYLHNRGVVHLDIKLENLLIDSNFSLKIADFDLSAFIGEENPFSRGTRFCRAPEILLPQYKASPAADIYSAGVALFMMKTGGALPHSEEAYCRGINFFELLNNNNTAFWNAHCQMQHQDPSFFDKDFRNLFVSMLKKNPGERATIQEIKSSKWYNGSFYTGEELKKLFHCSIRP